MNPVPPNDSVIWEVLAAYELPATVLGAVRYGHGHINDTFCVLCQPREGDCIRFILQGLSVAAFPHPEDLMENFVDITAFLRRKILERGGDPLRETLRLVKTRDGKNFYTDAAGKVWRAMPFIENTDCFQSATPELFETSARAFGRFQYLLHDTPPRPCTRPSKIITTPRIATPNSSPPWKRTSGTGQAASRRKFSLSSAVRRTAPWRCRLCGTGGFRCGSRTTIPS